MNIFLDTYGCAINKADSNIIRAILGKHNFTSLEKAEIVIVNSCAVKAQTESRVADAVRKYKRLGKRVILLGCLPRINPKLSRSLGVEIVDLDDYHLLPYIIDGDRALEEKDRIKLPMYDDSSVTGIIPIAEGCLGNCTYCAVKNARGRLRSYPEDWIVKKLKHLVKIGKKQIFITAQDTGCYGLDINSSLPELVKKLLEVEGEFRIRIGMMNPQFAKEISKDLLPLFSDKRLYRFVHIPLQSGSNKVLKDMKRSYTVEDFMETVKNFRKVKDMSIATDMIVAYPTESEGDFEDSMEVLKKTKPDVTNISKFYPRPMTEAARLKPLPTQILAERSLKMSKLCRQISLESNLNYVGRELECLVTGKTKYGQLKGRAINFKQVALHSGRLGEFVKVKVKGASPTLLKA
ncbi:threonylcarbamoyladenosine tRNA methylthiotransferase [Candidatus Micrarchaeota archaeon]|nr:MAG: threonylcarbamoyladenosine tRNA methylthiotransferase [Candidatus Micrarchaeota archaeon]